MQNNEESGKADLFKKKKPHFKDRHSHRSEMDDMDESEKSSRGKALQEMHKAKKIILDKKFLETIRDSQETNSISINKLQCIPFEDLVDVYETGCGEKCFFIRKGDLIHQICKLILSDVENPINIYGVGIIDVCNDGYGFIRSKENGYLPSNDDVFVSEKIINQNLIRSGDCIKYLITNFNNQQNNNNDRRTSISKIITINELNAEDIKIRKRRIYEDIIPKYPNSRFCLSDLSGGTKYAHKATLRILDLLSPIGKGQRGLIVAPPKSGKTTILQDIAESIVAQNDQVIVIILLVGERPEEVTEVKRSLGQKCQIFHSDFNDSPSKHVHTAQLCSNFAKRMFEMGKHVVVFMDSITRLARAYNAIAINTGRSLSGGVDANALYNAKKIFGIARNSDFGSITIIATCLVDTGSKMDEVIFEEVKGTGNMEIVLNRSLAEQGIFPAIDIPKTGTRRMDLLYNDSIVACLYKLRRFLQQMKNNDAIEVLISKVNETENNEALLRKIGYTKDDGAHNERKNSE